MDFLQRTPFFRLLLPFIIGIILYQYLELAHWALLVFLAISILVICASFFVKNPTIQYKFRWVFGSGIFLFLIVIAYFISDKNKHDSTFEALHQKGIFQVEIIAPPLPKAKSYLCKVEILQRLNGNTWESSRGKAIIYIQKTSTASNLLFGDKLLVSANFIPPQKALNPNEFDYASYLQRQGIGSTCYISSYSWQKIGQSTTFSMQREADKCRNKLLNVYREFKISGNEFAVLAALTLGYNDALDTELKTSYSASGAMHILSVSGMHVGVLYVVLIFLFSLGKRVKKHNIFSTIFIIIILWSYAFITGLSPAAVRATLMFSFIAIANGLERKSLMYNTVFMSAFFMLIYNPNYLFDVGFQLSYSAVLSIVFFQPAINKLYRPSSKLSKVGWDLIAVSIAAQLGTTPFTLYYFHQFPNYFLLTNLVAIPLSSMVIYLAITLLITSFIPYLSLGVAFILKWLLWLLNFLIVGIEHLPFSLSQISLDFKQTLALFTFVFFISAYFYTKKFAPLCIALFALLIVTSLNLITGINTLNSNRMIVYAGRKNTHISFIAGKHNCIYSTDSVEASKMGKSFWQNQKFEKPEFLKSNNWFLGDFAVFQGARICILNEILLSKTSQNLPFELDYLIIGNGLKPKIEQVLEIFHPKKIIVDTSISKWYTENIRQSCVNHGIAFYSVAEKGAYILYFAD